MGSRCVTNPNPSPNPNPNRNHNRNRNPNPNPNPNDGLEVCDCVAFLRRRVEPGSADLLLAAELGLGLGLGLTLTLTLALTLTWRSGRAASSTTARGTPCGTPCASLARKKSWSSARSRW